MNKLKIPRKKVVDEWELPYFDGSPEGEFEVLERKLSDRSRWSVIYELIVRIGDKFYSTTYSSGATESQDERPWEYETAVTFIEVKKVKKEIEVWETAQ